MGLELAVVLHGAPVSELALVEYLSRVLFHLVAFGALALLVRWVIGIGVGDRSGSVDR